MKVLVTGANGQLGQDVVKALQTNNMQALAYDRDTLDITDQEAVEKGFEEVQPDAVIHCAAYTQVDQAETDTDGAYDVNVNGTRNIVVAAEQVNAKVIYISTDYVFNGQGTKPYSEFDQCAPLGVYGYTKYAGEELTKSLSSKFFIVRTAWVYGLYGNNFVKTMLRLASERDELGVVADQTGSPTNTKDLAEFLVELIQTNKYGIYHGTNTGQCSWYDFAQAIFEEANVKVKVNPLTTADFPRPAPRPAYSVLGNQALRTNGFKPLPPWRESLRHFLKEWKQYESNRSNTNSHL
ncbi:dTDP-4-dehydrorhamnose reductase [Bacillus sp. HMF5848]|uniref:dTDP-4-dehydrorhamnose reductase n=1 Tax=Bacillus sp. HMF5848 TaxID=2495421 RepID=UPI000F7A105D|nr:dTDP-4-dehydrorhamnose reductase [Bacillus sp. HMF5848]RSK28666.1 dTDP-4-dehydrorhamnose reductase [Bacillus sp. HMF5848]